MPTFPDLFILRHGQTEWNLAGRYQGSLDSPLTALGRAQARQQRQVLQSLGETLIGADAFVSPQKRALDTAALALENIAGPDKSDPRLAEIKFGGWEGKTRGEIKALAPDIKLGTIFQSVSFFLVACIISIIILILFPQLALFIPNAMH